MRLKETNIKSLILFVGIISFMGCSVADLSSPSLIENNRAVSSLETFGRQILGQTNKKMNPQGQWNQFNRWEVRTTDEWYAPFIRAFTPIQQDKQKVQFNFYLKSNEVTLQYLEGREAGNIWGLQDKNIYMIRKGKRIHPTSFTTKLYLRTVKNYFLWPFTLRETAFVAYVQEVLSRQNSYYKVYVSSGGIRTSRENDQYVVWVNKDTQLIDFIEFTLRGLWSSYRGVVEYHDYRPVQGMLVPFEVRLGDRIGDKSYTHRFVVEKVNFE